MVMWWGEDMDGVTPKLQLFTSDNVAVADGTGEYTMESRTYPFLDTLVSQYTVHLDKETLDGAVEYGGSEGARLDYYKNDKLLRQEALSFRLCNLRGAGTVEDSKALLAELQGMGRDFGTSAKTDETVTQDEWVSMAIELAGGGNYTASNKELFQMQVAPTDDPTKFMGFITVNLGDMNDKDQVSGIYGESKNNADFDYAPGFRELSGLANAKKNPEKYGDDIVKEFQDAKNSKHIRSLEWGVGGYMESLIYYDFDEKEWKIQILNGGFNTGGGVSYSWNKTTWVGPLPLTTTLSVGGTAHVKMDALSVSYYDQTAAEYGSGNDFLTELRIYLYLRLFVGAGFDYSVVAMKIGMYGQVDVDMQFRWLNRPYMDTKNTIINVADGKSNKDGYRQDGQHYQIKGEMGLEYLIKFLFIQYEDILWSEEFLGKDWPKGDWNAINDSWKKNQDANRNAIDELLKDESLQRISLNGQQMYALNLAPTLEDRSYLDNGGRQWGPGISLFALDSEEQQGLKNLESNTYPYANPIVTDDGELVAYLSDMGKANVENTRAVYATKQGDSYQKAGVIDDGGYGDSQLSISGKQKFAVSAWTRQMVSLNKDQNSVLTDADQMMMMGGTEVYAAVYNGTQWETTRLTDNSTPDMAPVTAAKDGKAIVAWRSVVSSDAESITAFDQKDTILYRMYDGNGWSDAQVLYNGTSGAVKGITAAMLEDGTAAVAYTLDADCRDTTTADREIAYAVIDVDGTVSRNVQTTNDSYLDENPQLTSVEFPGHGERFVLGWFAQQSASSDGALDGGGSTSNDAVADIRLLEFGKEGVTAQLLPDSLNQIASGQNASITSNFRFTKNSNTINDLSILWVERAEVIDSENENSLPAEKDVLKGIKFYTYGENQELIGLTGVVDVAEMKDSTLIDHFDAYVSNARINEVKAVILGTTYGAEGAVSKTVQTVGGDQVTISVPSRSSAMYTATETYADKITVPSFLPDYETVKLGAITQIEFTVENRGIHPISDILITVGNTKTSVSDLNLLPGNSIRIMADYEVPGDKVVDPEYQVTATFNENAGASGTARTSEGGRTSTSTNEVKGTVYLDLPDAEITETQIVREENGERTIQVKLNNDSDAVLENSGCKVRLGFYTDVTCEKPVPGMEPVTIEQPTDLGMIDNGGYSTQATFKLSEYLDAVNADKAEADKLTELPDSGLTIHVKAEILDEDGNTQAEPVSSNNYSRVEAENLAARTGADAIITSTLSSTESGSEVSVTIQNTHLSKTTTGNVIVTLLDAQGNVLEQKQSYTGGMDENNGLLTLAGEAKGTKNFTFSKQGTFVQVSYSNLASEPDTDNASLNSLFFSNIPGVTLDDFIKDEEGNTYRYTVSAVDLTSTAVIAAAAAGGSRITVSSSNGEEISGETSLSATVALATGRENSITVTVTSGETSSVYILTVQNNSSSSGSSSPSYTVSTPEDTEHGVVMVSPKKAKPGQSVTITAKPDEGYQVGKVTVTDKDGNTIKVTGKGNDSYTFTMPDGKVSVDVTFVPEGQWSNPFVDVPDNAWYYDAVKYVNENGLMTGTGANTFEPNLTTTRGMLVTILYRLEGSPTIENEIGGYPFKDVDAGAWYATAVYWARMHGIVTGYSDELFGPNDTITREQMATILYRYAQYKGYDTTGKADLSKYTDAAQVSSYAEEAVRWANAEGLINGTSATMLSPKSDAIRAQVAAILTRFCQNIVK